MLSFILLEMGGLFEGKQIFAGFFIVCYVCIAVGGQIIKRGRL
jgi:hypothetical protein